MYFSIDNSDTWTATDISSGWHHVAVTHEVSTQQSTFWIDGVAVGTSSSLLSLGANSSSLWLGRERVNGSYAELSLAGVHLSQGVLYSLPFVPPYPLEAGTGTVALWQMDEGVGSTLSDSSAAGRHAALTGGTWSSCP